MAEHTGEEGVGMSAAITRTQAIARRLAHDVPNVDENLPGWARRSNPIIRRQLGAHWRVFPPQARPLLKWFTFFAIFLMSTAKYPFMFLFILTLLLAVILILPSIIYMYFRALGHIISDATQSIVSEFQNDTFTLLRTTPYSSTEIVLSKIIASVWRRMVELDMTLNMVAIMGAPPILMFYLYLWPPSTDPAIAQWMSVATYGSFLLRLPLEMFMVAALAVMMGAMTRLRSTAFSATATLAFFYFLLLNLARFLDLSWQMQLLVDAILPVVLPILISFGAIFLARRAIITD
jgi:hypothetical protein